MEELKTDKQFNVLKWIFIVVSIIHIIYATVTFRAMYADGGFFMISLLQNIVDKNYSPVADLTHTRTFILYLQEIPVYLANVIFQINNKFVLMAVYSLSLFTIPLLALLWNYKLSKRTKRMDIFLWSLFNYCAILLTFQIFSIVEIIIGSIFNFILWNYLTAKIEYTKKDIVLILFLTTMMFLTYEYVIILGIIFFIASFMYVCRENDIKAKIIKAIIGFGALAASVFDIFYMFNQEDESKEILRFMTEAYDFFPKAFELNILLTIVAGILLFVFAFINKKKLNPIATCCIVCMFLIAFVKLFLNQEASVYPMWEHHMRTIPCWLLPIIFMCMFISDIFKKEKKQIKVYNMICIVLICGIFQTSWQLINTYYWDKNIQYMKQELAKSDTPLYIPSEHELISDFNTPTLRRYIWFGAYAFTSIIFSDDYEQKTLLVNYDKPSIEGNITSRELLFVYPNENGKEPTKMSIPYGATIDIKNRFWDLTECAKALDEYNKQNNIQTWQ